MKLNLFWISVFVLGYLFWKQRTGSSGISNPGQNSLGNGPGGVPGT